MSRLMRWWHLSPSVNSIFKHACAAIHWGYTSDFWSDPSSTSILYVYEQRRLWIRAILLEPSLFVYAISTINSWAGSSIFGPILKSCDIISMWTATMYYVYFCEIESCDTLYLVSGQWSRAGGRADIWQNPGKYETRGRKRPEELNAQGLACSCTQVWADKRQFWQCVYTNCDPSAQVNWISNPLL